MDAPNAIYPELRKYAADVTEKKLLQTYTTLLERSAKSPVSASAERFLGMIRKLDRDLEKVVFLDGDGVKVSSLDLFVWSGLHRLGFHQLKRAEYNEVPNVTRWYDHIQYLVRAELGDGKLARLDVDLEPQVIVKQKKEAPEKPAAAAASATEGAAGKKAAKTADAGAAKAGEDLFPLLDLRVGLVTAVEKHPSADKLYVEKIDLGDGVRTIVSGLREFVKEEDFKGARVLVICNLKPRKIQGIESDGMVLCCSNADHTAVHLITAPASVAPGTRVQCGERPAAGAPKPETLNPKRKIWESAQPKLLVVGGAATYDGVPLTASGAPLTTAAPTGTIG